MFTLRALVRSWEKQTRRDATFWPLAVAHRTSPPTRRPKHLTKTSSLIHFPFEPTTSACMGIFNPSTNSACISLSLVPKPQPKPLSFMGCCFSSSSTSTSSSFRSSSSRTATVIGVDGSLTQYSVPVAVAKVLGIDHLSSFLCSSDCLSFDSLVPPLRSDDLLEENQIYFVLPKSMLGAHMTGADMAGLAVKASSALAMTSDKKGAKGPKIVSFGDATTPAVTRQGSTKGTLGRSAPSWAKALPISLRRTLSLIEEVDE